MQRPPPRRALVRAQAREHTLAEAQGAVAQAVVATVTFTLISPKHPHKTNNRTTHRRRGHVKLRLGFRFGSPSRPPSTSTPHHSTSHRSGAHPGPKTTRRRCTDPCRRGRLPRRRLALLRLRLGLLLGERLSLTPGQLLRPARRGARARTRWGWCLRFKLLKRIF